MYALNKSQSGSCDRGEIHSIQSRFSDLENAKRETQGRNTEWELGNVVTKVVRLKEMGWYV